MSRVPPPSTRALVSRDVVDTVKKKMGPPPGPPPSNMVSFKQPKTYRSSVTNAYGDGSDDEESDQEEEVRHHRSYKKYDDHGSDEEQTAASPGHYDSDTHSRASSDYMSKYHANSKSKASYRQDDEYLDDDHDDADPKTRRMSDSRRGSQPKKSPLSSYRSSGDEKSSFTGSSSMPSRMISSPSASISGAVIQASKNGVFNFQPLLKATYRDLRNFAWTPCEKGILVKCYIERDRTGANAFSPMYSLCADMDDGTGRELMVCRKVWKARTPHYVFSLKAEDLYRKREQRSRLYLGKLRGISATEYVLYDNGTCAAPEAKLDDDEEITEEELESQEQARRFAAEGNLGVDDGSLYRKELAVISFNSKKRPSPSGIRGTEVCLLPRNQIAVGGDEKSVAGGSKTPPHSYVDTFRKIRGDGKQNQIHRSKMIVIHEKTSRYDPLSACLVDLKGRASLPSVKNCLFVISDPMSESSGDPSIDDSKDFVLAIGKAFAICIARFDANLAWQR